MTKKEIPEKNVGTSNTIKFAENIRRHYLLEFDRISSFLLCRQTKY